MTKTPKEIVSGTPMMCDLALLKVQPRTVTTASLDRRGELAQKLLEVSMIAPKYNGMDQPAELLDVDTLVTRAFDAADRFYVEAYERECIVQMPSVDEILAANEAEKAAKREEKRRESEEHDARMLDLRDKQERRDAERRASVA